LVLLVLAAFAVRVGVVLVLHTEHDGPLGYEHGRIAENLLAGRGFTIELLGTEGPTSQQAPFYPLLMAGSYAIFGVGSPASELALQLLQCLAGALLVAAVAWLAWSLCPQRQEVGWGAALMAAFYPPHVYMVTHLQVAPWAALGLVLTLGVCAAAGRNNRGATAGPTRVSGVASGALAGILAGGLLLIEPIMALALPVCAVVLWRSLDAVCALDRQGYPASGPPDSLPHRPWHARLHTLPRSPGLRAAGVMTLTAALAITPWLARNWHVHGQPTFVKSTFGYAFWQANNPRSLGTDKIPKPTAERLRTRHDGTLAGMDRALWEARHETLYIDDVLLKPSGYAGLIGLSEPDRCKELGRRAWRFIGEHPGRYLGLCFSRLRFFLLFDETNPKAAHPLYRATTVVWLLLCVGGLLVSRRYWRSLWPTLAIAVLLTLFHAMVITAVRFRIPMEPLTFIWAGFVLGPALVEVRRHVAWWQHLPGRSGRWWRRSHDAATS